MTHNVANMQRVATCKKKENEKHFSLSYFQTK